MNAMHSWRDKDFVQAALQPNRQPQIAVVKQCVRLKDEFVNGERHKSNPAQTDLDHSEQGGEQHFTEVKPKTRGNVQVRINVVHIVKPPQEGNVVVQQVPVVKARIEQQKTNHYLQPPGHGHNVQHPKGSFHGPVQCRQGIGPNNQRC